MKKILSFVFSVALLGNIVCTTVALAETDSKIQKQITRSSSTILNSIDPDTNNPH